MIKTKKCSKCKRYYKLNDFYKCNHTKDKLQSQCKKCIKESSRKSSIINKNKIDIRIKKYKKLNPWLSHYYSLRKRCNNKKHKEYKRYGGKGIKAIISVEEIKYLWFKDKAYLMKTPSIDRKDNNKSYTIENCQFIEMKDNALKGALSTKLPIRQYDLDGNFIKEWDSIREALRGINKDIKSGNISICAKGKVKTAYGFIWKYKEDR